MTKADLQAQDYRAEAAKQPAPEQIRIDRVTLEITIDDNQLPAGWPWDQILRPLLLQHKGESVRVVSDQKKAPTTRPAETESVWPGESSDELRDCLADARRVADEAIATGSRYLRERDAASGERDNEKQRADRDSVKCSALADKVISLKARVAELEQAIMHCSGSCGFAGRSTQAASGGGEGAVADAWGVMSSANPPHRVGLHWDQELAERWARAKQSEYTTQLVVVPLYRSPPQPRGWLTGEEREMLAWVSNLDLPAYLPSAQEAAKVAKSLLARSSPPEVVLPELPFTPDSTHAMGWWEAIGKVKRALAAAGVKVKEVGSE